MLNALAQNRLSIVLVKVFFFMSSYLENHHLDLPLLPTFGFKVFLLIPLIWA